MRILHCTGLKDGQRAGMRVIFCAVLWLGMVCSASASSAGIFRTGMAFAGPVSNLGGLHARNPAASMGFERARTATRGSVAGLSMRDLLITKPRTSHCWYGLYFDIEAKDNPITVKEIQSACSSGATDVPLDIQVWMCNEGSYQGHEEIKASWSLCGQEKTKINTASFEKYSYGSTNVEYSALPFGKPIKIEAGTKQGFLVHTGHIGGLVLRGGFGKEARINAWSLGDKTDETSHIMLTAGSVCSTTPFKVEPDGPPRGFTGTIVYEVGSK